MKKFIFVLMALVLGVSFADANPIVYTHHNYHPIRTRSAFLFNRYNHVQQEFFYQPYVQRQRIVIVPEVYSAPEVVQQEEVVQPTYVQREVVQPTCSERLILRETAGHGCVSQLRVTAPLRFRRY